LLAITWYVDTNIKLTLQTVHEGGALVTTEITMAATREKCNPGLFTEKSTDKEGSLRSSPMQLGN